MRELWPLPDESIDIAARLSSDERAPHADRPWITLVMITSLDGAISVDGVSGGLGSPNDKARFLAARRGADAIVVGAATARAEDYQPAETPIAVVSGRLSLDPAARLFEDPDRMPILYTTDAGAAERGHLFGGLAQVVPLGSDVTAAGIAADLARRGFTTMMLEGGPTLNGHFLRADLVDELLLSVSPLVVGGDVQRLVGGEAMPEPRRFAVDRVLLGDDIVFVRYLRNRDD